MTSRRINSLLYLAAAALCVVGAASFVMLVRSLDESALMENTAVARPVDVAPPTADKTEQAMLASLEPILSRTLRGTAAPPASARPVPASKPTAPPTLVLVGTIGNSTAMLRTADGNVVARSVGQRLGDIEVAAIRASEIDVRSGGRVITLHKEKAPATP